MKLTHGGDIYSCDNDVLDFSANVNPLGLPLVVKEAIKSNLENYSCYPDPLCRDLRLAISKKNNVEINHIVCGNGAADIIFRAVLALKPKNALIIEPTFSEYEEALNLVDCNVHSFFLTEQNGFVLNEEIFNQDFNDIDIMFICNPNNPTGVTVDKEILLKLSKICLEKNIVLVIDECFIDFLDEPEKFSMIKHIKDYPNLIILKAFTKIYAMAGIRLGYGLCSDMDLINKIHTTLQPWSVSTVASVSGIAALGDVEYVNETRKIIKQGRIYLNENLNNFGFKLYDSQANYIFFRTKYTDLNLRLKEKNILIRSCSNFKSLNGEYFRIAVKSMANNIALVSSISDVLK